MPPKIYLDQDALINLYEQSVKNHAFKDKLDQGIAAGNFTVLSPWHWVETGHVKAAVMKFGQFCAKFLP